MMAVAAGAPDYVLRLYVTGGTPRAARAIANLRDICEHVLAGRCDLEVIDVLDRPQLADDDRILVTPTLVRRLPLPSRRVLGDLSDRERVLRWLELEAVAPVAPGVSGAPPAEQVPGGAE